MNEIDKLRQQIQEIDDSLLMLLKRRFELAREIGKQKKAQGLPIENLEVEAEKKKLWDGEDLEEVFDAILRVSRKIQAEDSK